MDIGYPWHFCGLWLCLSMLVEIVTLRADDRREAENISVLQRWCDVVNTVLRWPTHRYINHRVHWSPDNGSFPEVIGQLGYHANPERFTKGWSIKDKKIARSTVRHYSNSSAYVTCQPTLMIPITHICTESITKECYPPLMTAVLVEEMRRHFYNTPPQWKQPVTTRQ